jgi:hypothetical protein
MDYEKEEKLLRKICAVFNSTDNEIDLVIGQPKETYRQIIQDCFPQIDESDLPRFDFNEMVFLRELGYKTEAEQAVAPELDAETLSRITVENCAAIAMLDGNLGVFDFDTMLQTARELFAKYKDLTLEPEFLEKCKNMLDMFSNEKVGFIVKREEGFYEVNLKAKVN